MMLIRKKSYKYWIILAGYSVKRKQLFLQDILKIKQSKMRFVILLVLVAALGSYGSPIEGKVQYELLKGNL
jgi:hypothetical protein